MKTRISVTVLATLVTCGVATSIVQEPQRSKPRPEFDVLKADVGTWDVEIKTWAGPGEPTVTQGKETNRMLGDSWLLVDFEGNMMGMDFKGHGVYGYDAEQKTYVGTWVDSMSSNQMAMVGQYDEDKNTMTYEGIAPGMDGKPAKHILTTTYKDDGGRSMTMHIEAGEANVKVFEMSYTKAE